MKTARDSQRTKVYRAERVWSMATDWEAGYVSWPDIEVLHEALTNDPELCAIFDVPVEVLRRVALKKRRGNAGRSCFLYRNDSLEGMEIRICKRNRDEIESRLRVYLHELAHAIHYVGGGDDAGEASHGPEFAGIMLKLVEHVIGVESRQKLFIAYCGIGVKVTHVRSFSESTAIAAGPK